MCKNSSHWCNQISESQVLALLWDNQCRWLRPAHFWSSPVLCSRIFNNIQHQKGHHVSNWYLDNFSLRISWLWYQKTVARPWQRPKIYISVKSGKASLFIKSWLLSYVTLKYEKKHEPRSHPRPPRFPSLLTRARILWWPLEIGWRRAYRSRARKGLQQGLQQASKEVLLPAGAGCKHLDTWGGSHASRGRIAL